MFGNNKNNYNDNNNLNSNNNDHDHDYKLLSLQFIKRINQGGEAEIERIVREHLLLL